MSSADQIVVRCALNISTLLCTPIKAVDHITSSAYLLVNRPTCLPSNSRALSLTDAGPSTLKRKSQYQITISDPQDLPRNRNFHGYTILMKMAKNLCPKQNIPSGRQIYSSQAICNQLIHNFSQVSL